MGTAWDGTSDRDPVAFEFRPGGVLHYTSPSGAYDNGTWVQKGRNVTFEMNGHFVEYEGTIDALCRHRVGGGLLPAKIVASTATICRAADQVRSLYAREVFMFPPQGLQAGARR